MNILVSRDQKLYEKKILNFFTWLWEGAKDSLKAAGAEDGGIALARPPLLGLLRHHLHRQHLLPLLLANLLSKKVNISRYRGNFSNCIKLMRTNLN